MLVFLLFLFWIILNGRVTVEIVVIGAALSAALACFAKRLLHISLREEMRFLRCLPGALLYLLYLLGQIIKANFQVIRVILHPGKGRPKLVWFKLPLEGSAAQLTLANSITLTPGTVTVTLGENTICVYAMRPEMAEGLKDSGFVKRLRRLEEKYRG